ncbi:MAG: 30S ribosome-binding factor RbfA [Rhodospirillales bacterium]|nr:30S ribosome-binding factor RbfA [Rhodospirillales bacterium]
MAKRGDKTPSHRQLRVGEQVRHALATVIERGELRDPELAGISVTVTEVRLSPDLRNAYVFVVPLGGGEADDFLPPLRRATPYFRRRLADSVQLKYVPNLTFEADTSFDYAEHMQNMIGRLDDKDQEHGP